MTTFRIAPDDVGIRNLRLENSQPASGAKAVDPVPVTPKVHAPEEEPTDYVTARTREAIEERRRGDRRKKRQPVMLDTRSDQERRAAESSSGASDTTPQRIDIMV